MIMVPQLSVVLGALLVLLPALANARPSPSPTLERRWAAPSPALSLGKYDKEVFDVAMTINDWAWEPSTGWIESDDDNVSDTDPKAWGSDHLDLVSLYS
jgi:hypothetical protein